MPLQCLRQQQMQWRLLRFINQWMNKKFVIRSVISNDDVDDRSLEGVQCTLMTAAGTCCCADIMQWPEHALYLRPLSGIWAGKWESVCSPKVLFANQNHTAKKVVSFFSLHFFWTHCCAACEHRKHKISTFFNSVQSWVSHWSM